MSSGVCGCDGLIYLQHLYRAFLLYGATRHLQCKIVCLFAERSSDLSVWSADWKASRMTPPLAWLWTGSLVDPTVRKALPRRAHHGNRRPEGSTWPLPFCSTRTFTFFFSGTKPKLVLEKKIKENCHWWILSILNTCQTENWTCLVTHPNSTEVSGSREVFCFFAKTHFDGFSPWWAFFYFII